MAKETMRRRASDNAYLHRDFHGALSVGIEYLHERLGEDAVHEYLRAFTRAYYAPLREAVKTQGLAALRAHFERLYEAEGGEISIRMDGEDELAVEVLICPAVSHMRERGYPIARLWIETERTINAALCEGTPFAAELIHYDEATGRSLQRFFRRPSP